jgi:CubicO group peptidase (beta-lactamase class C family)
MAGLGVFGYGGYAPEDEIPTLLQVLDGAPPSNVDPVRVMQAPGSGYAYSGGGYCVLQQLMEDVTGRPFADLTRALVLDPLGMAYSTFEQPLPAPLAGQAAVGHRTDGAPIPGAAGNRGWHTYPQRAAGGLWSTPSDLARFAVELFRAYRDGAGAVLSQASARQALTPPPGGFYGFGLVAVEVEGRKKFEHPGINEGYRAHLTGWPESGQGVVWMANGDAGDLVGQELTRGLAQALGWPGYDCVEKKRATGPAGPARYAGYAGTYRPEGDSPFGARIRVDEEGLIWEDLPYGARFRLYPAAEDVFFRLEYPDEITFLRDDEGRTEALRVGEFWRMEREG